MYNPLLSPEGRAVQSAMANLPPDQQMQYLNDSVAKGLIPFGQAVALKMMTERVAQNPPVQPGQANQPTVMDEYKARFAQAHGQDPRAGGIAQLPAANMGRIGAASGGVIGFEGGGLPAQEQAELEALNDVFVPQSYAHGPRGGISGPAGPVYSDIYYKLSPEKRRELSRRRDYLLNQQKQQEINQQRAKEDSELAEFFASKNLTYKPSAPQSPRAGQAAQAGQTPVDVSKYLYGSGAGDRASSTSYSSRGAAGSIGPSVNAAFPSFAGLINRAKDEAKKAQEAVLTPEQFAAQREAQFEKAGIMQPYTQRAEKLSKEESALKSESAKDRRLAMALGFFEAAANAQPGQGFLGSVASGVSGAVRGTREVNKETKKAQRELDAALFELEKVKSDIRLKNIENGDEKYYKALARAESAQDRVNSLEFETGKLQAQLADSAANRAASLAATRFSAASRFDREDPIRQLEAAYIRAHKDPAAQKELSRQINTLRFGDVDPASVRAAQERAAAAAANKGNIPIGVGSGLFDGTKLFSDYSDVNVK